jgi:phage shock protein PspC (stress-responsive transcriptional regulator)
MVPGRARRQAGVMNTAPYPPTDSATAGQQAGDQQVTRPLCRPRQDRMLAGVAAGFARYLGVDVLLVRVALVVLCFVGGVGLPLYLASWLLIPDEGAEQSIATEFTDSMQDWRN